MVPKEAIRDGSAGLAQAIERQIVQRTWGRIHRLQVEVIKDRVVVHGYTQTHYVKQLALEGVRDVIGDCDGVELDVQVGPHSASPIRRHYSQGQVARAAG
jgi:hypothetical protein